MLPLNQRDFSSELIFRTSRSSGSGGQNVNKVSTRVELIFYVATSQLLTPGEKELLASRLGKKIRNDGAIHMISQEERTQLGNKRKVVKRFLAYLEKALKVVKQRKTKVLSESEKENRLIEKKKIARVKYLRMKPDAAE